MKIDMAEATRLTKLGRLSEAMAILRGGTIDTTAEAAANKPDDFIEMVQEGGTWNQAFTATFAGNAETSKTRIKPKVSLSDIVKSVSRSRAGSPSVEIPAGASFETLTHAGLSGSRSYKLYVPSHYGTKPMPLVIMLHGCTQNADDFAIGTRMNALAEQEGLIVAYPEQSKAANMNGCWNWFSPNDQKRDAGEPAILAGIARDVIDNYRVDATRVFIAGLSAGGAMAAIMGAAYPDLFAAVGVHSGLAVGSAHDMPSAFAAMGQGAKTAPAGRFKSPVRMIVFHGDSDHTVKVANSDLLSKQALAGSTASTTIEKGRSSGGKKYTRTIGRNAAGDVQSENWILHNSGHAWSGGDALGTYTDSTGPDASAEMVRFFLMKRL